VQSHLRIDRWLWQARFFRTRAEATRFCETSSLRVNGRLIAKAHHPVRVGDVLTLGMGARVRVVRVRSLPTRRVGAATARAFYDDLSDTLPRPG
jgi:ribosome-associated heat shock protein Hsp15